MLCKPASYEWIINSTFIFTFLRNCFPKVYLPKIISRVFTNKFLLIYIASVSGQCMHYIFKISQIVEGISMINQFHFFFTVLGNYFRWAWNWSHWHLSWRQRSPIRENQRILQWSLRRQICPPRCFGWSRTWYHGLSQIGTLWTSFQTR